MIWKVAQGAGQIMKWGSLVGPAWKPARRSSEASAQPVATAGYGDCLRTDRLFFVAAARRHARVITLGRRAGLQK